MPRSRLLLVEDDPRIVSFLQPGLRSEGYAVEVARDGDQALGLGRSGDFPLIVLDHMLPTISGLDVCKMLRSEGCSSHILMLTAKDSLQDRVAGLRGGADDYLTKPFAFDELLARLEALARRSRDIQESQRSLMVGDLVLNPATKSLTRAGQQVELTPKEYSLLAYLMANAGTVISRAQLLSNVWGMHFDPSTKVVEVYIQYLRRKVDSGRERPLLRTVRGFGYCLASGP